jgi:hypothetical protein
MAVGAMKDLLSVLGLYSDLRVDSLAPAGFGQRVD